MPYELLTELINTHKPKIIRNIVEQIYKEKLPYYNTLTVAELTKMVEPNVDVIGKYLSIPEVSKLSESIRAGTEARVQMGIKLETVLRAGVLTLGIIRRELETQLALQYAPDDKELVKTLRWLDQRIGGLVTLGQSNATIAGVKLTNQ